MRATSRLGMIVMVIVASASFVSAPALGQARATQRPAVTGPTGWQLVPAANVESTPAQPSGPNQALYSTSCVGSTCMAVGDSITTPDDGYTARHTVAETNAGGRWTTLPTPDPSGPFGDTLHGVSCASVDYCVAVGEQNGRGIDQGADGAMTLTESWDGTAWTEVPTPDPVLGGTDADPGSSRDALLSVSCPEVAHCMSVGLQAAQPQTGIPSGQAAGTQQLQPVSGDYAGPNGGTTVTTAQPASSPDGTYTATWGSGNVVVKKGATTVLTAAGSYGGFSGDSHEFVVAALNSATAVNHVALYNLRGADPSTPIWTTAPAVSSSRIAFSPSGHYLLYASTNGSQSYLTMADATVLNPAGEHPFTTGAIATAGAPQIGGDPGDGDDLPSTGTLAYGFGPDDSRFLYVYLAAGPGGSQRTEWRWVDLASPNRAVHSLETTDPSAYAQFSPGGSVLGIVTATAPFAVGDANSVSVHLYASATGAPIAAGGPYPTKSPLKLHSSTTQNLFTVGSNDYALAPNTDSRWIVQSLPTPTYTVPDGFTAGSYQGDLLRSIACVSLTNCTAVGQFTATASSRNGTSVDLVGALVDHLDGSGWHQVDAELSAGGGPLQLYGVSCVGVDGQPDAADCTAVGQGLGGQAISREHAAADAWTTWSASAPAQTAQGADYILNSVSCMSAADCTAVGTGRPDGASERDQVLIEHYDGTAWKQQVTPDVVGGAAVDVEGVSCTAHATCTAVGRALGGRLDSTGPRMSNDSSLVLNEGGGWDTGITVSPSAPAWNSLVTIAVHLSGPGPGPAGIVASLGSCQIVLSDGAGTCTVNSEDIGAQREVQATLLFGTGGGADAALTGTWTAPVTVAPAPTTTTLSMSQPTVTAGQSVGYTVGATEDLRGTQHAVGGLITVTAGAVQLCQVYVSTGTSMCNSTIAPVGTDEVTARYLGTDSTLPSATSAQLIVTPASDGASTQTAVSVTPGTTTNGTSVEYSATVTAATTGVVDFSVGATELCAAQLDAGRGSCASSAAPTGSDTVTGTFGGDGTHAPSSGTASLAVVPATTNPRAIVTNSEAGTLSTYVAPTDGDTAPTAVLSGLAAPSADVVDSLGRLWVADCGSGSVVEFAATAIDDTGSPNPIAKITGLDCPNGLAFDRAGDLWVLERDANDVVEYPEAQLSSALPTPSVRITDKSDDATCGDTILRPAALAFGADGALYVASPGTACVAQYSADQLGSSAAAEPHAFLIAVQPSALAVDGEGALWLATNDSLEKFSAATLAALAADEFPAAAVQIGEDGSEHLDAPGQLIFDTRGDLWAVSAGGTRVLEYLPEQLNFSGIVRPHVIIQGTDTGLSSPLGIAVDETTQAPSTVTTSGTVGLTPMSVTSGSEVSYSAALTPGDAAGTVVFSTGQTQLCSATIASGAGSCTSSAAPVGSDSISGAYSGDPTHSPAALTPATLTVSAAIPPAVVPSAPRSPRAAAAKRAVTVS
ncbi:MAG TPA: Ig-like domain repeat protein, partial [Jatrophihabitantaceae bacterium]|nr:Ig-like domain repeat protein [Jatrophihabitantaceae bacterium]